MEPITLTAQETIMRLNRVGNAYLREVNLYNQNSNSNPWRFWQYLNPNRKVFKRQVLARSLSSFTGVNVLEHFTCFLQKTEISRDFDLSELSNDELITILPQLLITQIKEGRMFDALCDNFSNNPDRPDPFAHTAQRKDMARTRI